MIVGQFPPMDSDEENADHGLGADDDDHHAVVMSDGENAPNGDNDDRDRSPSPESAAFLRPMFWRSPPPSFLRGEDDMAFGGMEPSEEDREVDREVRMENGVAYKDSAEIENSSNSEDEEIGAASAEDTTTSNTASEAIIIRTSKSSSTNGYSYSASYSSGIGTCSSFGAESESGGNNADDIASSADDLVKNGTTTPTMTTPAVFDHDDAYGVDFSSFGALPKRNSSAEDHRGGERMEDIAEVQEEPCVAVEAEEPECLEEDEGVEALDPGSGISFRSCMQEKVNMLPVPAALKDYLLFYRK